MATFNSAGMTSGAVLQNALGVVNTHIETYLQRKTVSAAGQINMHRLPPGAQVVDVQLFIKGVPGAGMAVKDSHGNVYMNTATAADTTEIVARKMIGPGNRLTSSAYIYIEHNGIQAALAGGDSADYTLITNYLSRKDGD